jgi:uncharacterized protein YaeQ
MALTIHNVTLTLSDVDRGVYDTLSLQVARHPSESPGYLVARILAYALEVQEGIAFTQGLSVAEEPAIEVRDLTGARTAWIEVGTPQGERLHRALKAVDRVAVYCHKDPTPWLRQLEGTRLHAPERLHLFGLERSLVDALAGSLDRRIAWSLSRSDGELYVDAAGTTHTAALRPLTLA